MIVIQNVFAIIVSFAAYFCACVFLLVHCAWLLGIDGTPSHIRVYVLSGAIWLLCNRAYMPGVLKFKIFLNISFSHTHMYDIYSLCAIRTQCKQTRKLFGKHGKMWPKGDGTAGRSVSAH